MTQHIYTAAYFNLRRRSIDVVELSKEEWDAIRPRHSHLDDIVAGDGSTPPTEPGGDTPAGRIGGGTPHAQPQKSTPWGGSAPTPHRPGHHAITTPHHHDEGATPRSHEDDEWKYLSRPHPHHSEHQKREHGLTPEIPHHPHRNDGFTPHEAEPDEPHTPEPYHARLHEQEHGASPRTVHTETPHEYTRLGPAGGKFDEKAPAVMRALQRDYGLTPEQAAGAVGNLGEESTGFKQLQEVNPTVRGSRGGYGWAQWTGSRRRDFEKWVAENNLNPASDEANYGFMRHELDTNPHYIRTIPAMRGAKSVDEAVHTWMQLYEQPGKPAENIRRNYAHRALRAYNNSSPNDTIGGPAETASAPAPTRVIDPGFNNG